MPILSVSKTGTITSSLNLKPGAYHATQLVITEKARENSTFFLDNIGIYLIKAKENKVVWSESFGSCFPVICTFKNGDIAFCHHNNSELKPLQSLLKRRDIKEIQAIGKKDGLNSRKIEAFAYNLTFYFAKKDHKPAINIALTSTQLSYNMGLVYKAADGKPIILMASSPDKGAMPLSVNAYPNDEDVINDYEFESAYEHDYTSLRDAQHKMSLGLFKEVTRATPQREHSAEEEMHEDQEFQQLIQLNHDPKKQCLLF